MGMIGSSASSSNTDVSGGNAYIDEVSALLYTPDVSEEVYLIGIFQKTNMNGQDAVVGVYDVTLGSANADLVGFHTFTAIDSELVWLTKTLDIPLTLEADHIYAMCMYSASTWYTRTTGNWGTLGIDSSVSALPDPFSRDTSQSGDIGMYALTQTAASAAATFTASITLSKECISNNFATGMTAVKNLDGTPEYATELVALTQVKSRPAGGQATNTAVLYTVTFAEGKPVFGTDDFDFVYDDAVGDIAAISVDGLALASETQSASVCV